MDTVVCFLFLIVGCCFITVSYKVVVMIPQLNEVIQKRKFLMDKQFDLFDTWRSTSLDQQQQFYLYNVTNIGELNISFAQMQVEEIGPFVYNTKKNTNASWENAESFKFLSFDDMEFLPNNSIAAETSTVYVVNITLMKSLYTDGLGIAVDSSFSDLREGFILKTTVKELLKEVIDGYSMKVSSTLPPNKRNFTCKKTISRDFNHEYDYNDYFFINNSYNYFEDQFCVKLEETFRLVNAPFCIDEAISTTFEKLPCECLKFSQNGTELIKKIYPDTYEVMTKRFFLLWNDDSCSGLLDTNVHTPSDDASFREGFFSITSHIYFGDKDYISYIAKCDVENVSGESHINIEPMTDVITDIVFRYQLNIHIKFTNGTSKHSSISHKIYPILLIEITGKSKNEINYSLYHHIVYPWIFTHYVFKEFFNVITGIVVFATIVMMCSAKYLREI